MKTKYRYYKSSTTEPKHEITRKELVKALGESSHCTDARPLVNGLYYSVANYKKAECEVRKAQRASSSGTIWSCGSYTLYLDKDYSQMRRRRDSRYPD